MKGSILARGIKGKKKMEEKRACLVSYNVMVGGYWEGQGWDPVMSL